MTYCKFCGHGGKPCGAIEPTNSFICTRLSGHEGYHVACGSMCVPREEWENLSEPTNQPPQPITKEK